MAYEFKDKACNALLVDFCDENQRIILRNVFSDEVGKTLGTQFMEYIDFPVDNKGKNSDSLEEFIFKLGEALLCEIPASRDMLGLNKETPLCFLYECGRLGYFDLIELYDEKNIKMLKEAAIALLGKGFEPKVSNAQEFVVAVCGLEELARRTYWKYGEAIVMSEKLYIKGEKADAIEILEIFVQSCKVKVFVERGIQLCDSYKDGTYRVENHGGSHGVE